VEVLDLVTIPLAIIEAILTMLLFIQILNINSTRRQKIIYVFTFSGIALFSNFLIPTTYNTYINALFQPILVFLIFRTNMLKTILSIIIPYGIFVLIDSIIQIGFLLFLHISANEIMTVLTYKIGFSLFEYMLAFIIYKIFKRFNIRITLFDNMYKSTLYTLIINFFAGVIAIGVQAYFVMKYTNIIPDSLLITNILVLLTYFIISIYSLFRTDKLEITKKDLEKEKLYNKTITILYDSIRGFRHDFNNIVQAIGGYVATENMKRFKSIL